MRQTLVCPRCATQNAAGFRFCGTCGGVLIATCPYCKTLVNPELRFCPTCGAALSGEVQQITSGVQGPQAAGSVHVSFCENCLCESSTKHVALYQNIGLIVMRLHKSVEGNLCRACIRKYFWQFTTITLFLGWWGVISFFMTLFILPNNLIRYLSSLGLPGPR
jgi:hypothetical protein